MSDDQRQPPPIKGSPPGAPCPPFPSESVTPSAHGRDFENANTLPEPDEIARRIDALTSRKKAAREKASAADHDARRIALECDLSTGKWLAAILDGHQFTQPAFLEYARQRGIKSKTTAYDLAFVGQFADAELAKCRDAAKLSHRYKWPTWGQIHDRLKRSNHPPADPEPSPEPVADVADVEPEPEPVEPEPEPEAQPADMPRADTKQGEPDDAQQQIADLKARLVEERKRRADVEEERDKLIDDCSTLQGKVNLNEDDLETQDKQIDTLKAERDQWHDMVIGAARTEYVLGAIALDVPLHHKSERAERIGTEFVEEFDSADWVLAELETRFSLPPFEPDEQQHEARIARAGFFSLLLRAFDGFEEHELATRCNSVSFWFEVRELTGWDILERLKNPSDL